MIELSFLARLALARLISELKVSLAGTFSQKTAWSVIYFFGMCSSSCFPLKFGEPERAMSFKVTEY